MAGFALTPLPVLWPPFQIRLGVANYFQDPVELGSAGAAKERTCEGPTTSQIPNFKSHYYRSNLQE